MNIQLIKEKISSHLGITVKALDVSRQYTAVVAADGTVSKGEPLPWFSAWIEEGDVRARIVFPADVFESVKADPSGFNGLAMKAPEVRNANVAGKKPYTMIVIITPEIAATF